MKRNGFTLVEILVSLVVMGIGMAGMISAFSVSAKSNADPMVRKQMLSIAEGMMEEIALKPYAVSANVAPAACARDTYNDIQDYNGYSTANVCDISGSAISSLSGYGVTVSVVSAAFSGVPASLKITVTVTHGTESVKLTGWRTGYAA